MFEIDRQKFGAFVAELRKENGLTQKELAQRLFLSDKAVSKWERGFSVPDVGALVPLADILGVTVTELLEGQRMERSETMDPERVEELVKKSLHFSEEEQQKAARRRVRRAILYGVFLFFACGELALLVAKGYTAVELVRGNVILVEILCTVFGGYFLAFAKEQLPSYYDENRINAYSHGCIRMNLPGVSFNNSNWPYIVRVGQVWSMSVLLAFPMVYLVLSSYLPVVWAKLGLYITLALLLGGLFIPLYAVAKRYE